MVFLLIYSQSLPLSKDKKGGGICSSIKIILKNKIFKKKKRGTKEFQASAFKFVLYVMLHMFQILESFFKEGIEYVECLVCSAELTKTGSTLATDL